MTARRFEGRPCSMVRPINRSEGKVRWRRRSGKVMTNMMDDFMAECEFVGAKKQTIKTVKKMIKDGRFSNSEIAGFANLTEAEVKSLNEELNIDKKTTK